MPEDSAHSTPSTVDTDAGAEPVTPAQDPAPPVAPVPAPGHADSSDASVRSPGPWTPIAAPGKPDGEVDTRP